MVSFPSRIEVAYKTGLSRQTVNKHLRSYQGSKEFKQKQEEYTVMREKLLSKIYVFAVEGNMKAARLFFEITSNGQTAAAPGVTNQQNNFIQINGTIVTQKQLEELPSTLQNQVIEALKNIQL